MGLAGSRRTIRLIVGLLVSAVFLYATFKTIPLPQVATILGGANPVWIVATLFCIVLAYLLKIARWTYMLRKLGAKVGLPQTAPPLLGSVALNNVLPFRAGDILRVFAFERYTSVPTTGQVSTLALERLMDVIALCSILFFALFLSSNLQLESKILLSLQIVALGAVVSVFLFIAAPRILRPFLGFVQKLSARMARPAALASKLAEYMHALAKPGFLICVFAWSLAAWLAEGAAYLTVGMAIGIGFNLQLAFVALGIGTLSTLIPSSPGYVGTFHFFVTKVAVAFGFGAAIAASFAVLIHALLWLVTTIGGFALLAFTSNGRRASATLRLSDQA